MKTIKPSLAVCLVVISLLLNSCCFQEHKYGDLRIKTFTWDNVLYKTEYTNRGLLKKLKATDRDIVFYYDENKKLYRAEIVFQGSSAPESVFEYVQGPKGITRITWTRDSVYLLTDITYASDGKITKVVNAFYGSTDPYNQHTLAPTYQGNNVSKLINSINGNDFTQIRSDSFDNKPSPFRMLGKSVNNPAFFPLGYYVFFQVLDYNIPYTSWLSENNPVNIIYGTVGDEGGFHATYPLTYVYNHDLVTQITWGNTDAPDNARTFKFEYGFY